MTSQHKSDIKGDRQLRCNDPEGPTLVLPGFGEMHLDRIALNENEQIGPM